MQKKEEYDSLRLSCGAGENADDGGDGSDSSSGMDFHGGSKLSKLTYPIKTIYSKELSDIFYNTVGGVVGGLVYYATMKARKRL